MRGTLAATDVIWERVITYFLNPLYQIVLVCSFLYFIGSVTYFLFQMNKADKRELARTNLLYGLIGLLIMLSVGPIIKFINGIVGGGLEY